MSGIVWRKHLERLRMDKTKELLHEWIDKFNNKKLDAVVNCYREDAVNFQIATGQPSAGIDQIRIDTAEFFKGFPDAWANIENTMSDGDWAAWEWIGGGTFLGEFYGDKPTGKSFEIWGCGFFRFDRNKIILQRGYWDKLDWFNQIGLKIK